jgi:hypothetical protein
MFTIMLAIIIPLAFIILDLIEEYKNTSPEESERS